MHNSNESQAGFEEQRIMVKARTNLIEEGKYVGT